ncbi:4-(cytidine 5'-diphospho)-2-C-methyl-D-erythritol kinase [Pseudohongiella spirulinae]|uniref:4-diphosphocytidyl-2-C-methyl-D-erythritol kinase n=1 Tax=Pseudohongiella spirulinae TaxID=1249552 RepID=A0A0S2KAV2_9GAMM|nr:4-(cytidine 5'-diphospho)-2-C-methyl-D-erythritol kinase [Pseudohongiella spirulinae]ALO45434.1 kinase [Pseudohongiella spirulinae]
MTGTTLTIPAPAKLNLFLHITGRRADGYHTLQSVFQLLDYGDELTISPRNDGQLRLQCSEATLNDDNNLVLKAARALQKLTNADCGADITLHKRIPAGAGLGGGSSDAASTLVGLNKLWNLQLSRSELARIGLPLGADVPVFVMGQSAWAEGIGEQLTPVELPDKHYLVLTPACHITTAAIFSHQELTRDTSPIKMHAFLTGQSRNDCEPLVRQLFPPVDAALRWLSGYAPARMTGTGASVFAAFDDQSAAREALRALHESAEMARIGVRGFVAKGVNRSEVYDLMMTAKDT